MVRKGRILAMIELLKALSFFGLSFPFSKGG